ncbi:MAG: sulfur carrier protein ThiS [bacterium]
MKKEIVLNDKKHSVSSDSVEKLMDELSIRKDYVSVIKNKKIVKRKNWSQTSVNSGDIFELFSPVGGG